MIVINNPKLKELLDEKERLVKAGRKISSDMEMIEKKLAEETKKQGEITEKVNPPELIKKGEELKLKINPLLEELDKVSDEIQKAKIDAIPQEDKDRYYMLKKEYEDKEEERNKLGLKIQKIKDRAIPIINKEVKPHLGEYDDIETARVVGHKIVVNTFNHLEQWKEKFSKKSQ